MKLIIVKSNTEIKYGNISKVADFVKVHKNTVSRWQNSGDRVVYKNGFEIYFNAEKL